MRAPPRTRRRTRWTAGSRNTRAGLGSSPRRAWPRSSASCSPAAAAGRPSGPVPLVPGAPQGDAGAAAVTWFGHSSVLLEIDGHRVLADPMWSERASPFPADRAAPPAPDADGPRPPARARRGADLARPLRPPRHGDGQRARRDGPERLSSYPLGIEAHLRRWGVPAARIVELDWGAAAHVGGLTLTCVECRHFSGRGPARNTTQWSSWAVTGPTHRAYFGGDTGYTAAFVRTGADLGPFDLTLLPIGAYADLWPDIHMTPEEAVAHTPTSAGGCWFRCIGRRSTSVSTAGPSRCGDCCPPRPPPRSRSPFPAPANASTWALPTR